MSSPAWRLVWASYGLVMVFVVLQYAFEIHQMPALSSSYASAWLALLKERGYFKIKILVLLHVLGLLGICIWYFLRYLLWFKVLVDMYIKKCYIEFEFVKIYNQFKILQDLVNCIENPSEAAALHDLSESRLNIGEQCETLKRHIYSILHNKDLATQDKNTSGSQNSHISASSGTSLAVLWRNPHDTEESLHGRRIKAEKGYLWRRKRVYQGARQDGRGRTTTTAATR